MDDLRVQVDFGSGGVGKDFPHDANHFYRRLGSAFARVSVFPAGALPRLLLVVGRQHTEDDGKVFGE